MKSIKEAYDAGYDCGTKGADTVNCHFTFFATKELTEAHSKGVKDAENKIKKAPQ